MLIFQPTWAHVASLAMYVSHVLILCIQITRERLEIFNVDPMVKCWLCVSNLLPSNPDRFCFTTVLSLHHSAIFIGPHCQTHSSGQCCGCPDFPSLSALQEFAAHMLKLQVNLISCQE